MEDEPDLRRREVEYFRLHGLDVAEAGDLTTARTLLQDHRFDIVALDLRLGQENGMDLLHDIGRRGFPPVVITSVLGEDADRVLGLELGADDYLVKPVDLEEVTARVRAITRRAQQARLGDGSVLSHGELRLQPARRAAVWKGTLVPLTNREFWLLETLVRKKGQIVSRERLEEALYGWGDEIDSNTVEVYIHHLRRKLGPGLIRTVRGLGYHLAEADSEVSGVHGA